MNMNLNLIDKTATANKGFTSGGLKCKIPATVFQMNISNNAYFCASFSRPNAKPRTVNCHCMKASTKNELMSEKRENIIQNYIEGYNKFDVEKMLLDLDNEIIFQNIQNGEINLTLNGINEFKDQAEKSKLYFEKRQQKITSIKHTEDKTEIEIDYFAVLGIDFPNGLKKGQKLELKGKTIFTFKNNKIISISDIS